jgi:hypothetical protein
MHLKIKINFNPSAQTFYPKNKKATNIRGFKKRAGEQNRTVVSSLEGWSNSHYTTPANGV